MNVLLNNREESFEESDLTISQLLELKKYTFKMLVIKVNGILVKKDEYDTFTVNGGDDIQVLHLISGG
ncbi:MAG: thiamine biosynthesis protein ThiS [Bacteroidetes bacterium GWA2_31_9b]|nr:MAG: thiamine biosynthesis protein ThiS [Bacteroidetes bacterium GWA2_31_9b]